MAQCMTNTPSGITERSRRYLLLVDSNSNELFYSSMVLQRLEYNICTAQTAEEALDMANVAVPALIIVDMELKDMSGLELARKLGQQPRTASIPVILKTEHPTKEIEQRCRENGCVACIQNPVRAEELYRAVQAAVENTPRKNIRILTRLPVTVNDLPLECAEGECVSVISAHGMYIRTLKPYAVGTKLKIKIDMNGRIIVADSVVLYCHRFGEGPFKEPGMGLQFTHMSTDDQDLIQQYIRQELMSGIKPL